MGLFTRIKDAVESRLDGPTPGAEKPAWAPGQPWATLIESEHRPGASTTSTQDGGGLVDIAIDAVGGIPYRFVLEVHRPGLEVYRLPMTVRIPSKVERTLMQGSQRVQAGTEVPLHVTGPAPENVAIDWDGYLARPGRRAESQRLGGENQLDQIGAQFEQNNKPAKVAKIRADNRASALSLADMVVAGQVTREAFEQNLEPNRRMGHLAQADYDEAVARIDAAR